jgi:hypothetical protein
MSLVHPTFTELVTAVRKLRIHSRWAVKGSEMPPNAKEKLGNFIPIILLVP